METTLIVLDVAMALLLWWRRGCKWFALIQTLQLLEIYPMHYASLEPTKWWDGFNALVNVPTAVYATEDLKFPRVLMVLWSLAVIVYYSNVDINIDMVENCVYWSYYHLNNATIVILLGYAVTKPTLRLWRTCVIEYRYPCTAA